MRGPGASAEGLGACELVAEVRAVLDAALASAAPAGVAVSGGPDSVALALLAARARPDLRLRVLHVQHGLRDDRADVAAARALAGDLAVPCSVLPVEVGLVGGPEAAARTARHAALRRGAVRHGLAGVLLGHTAEDQAETVLLNLARGAGLGGIAGMRPVREVGGGVRLIRPLLRLRRADVRAIATAAGAVFVHDPTNDDRAQRRRRARVEALPALARLAGGPGDPVVVLTRLAALARADEDLLAAQAREAGRGLIEALGPLRLARWERMAELPRALARRVVRDVVAGSAGAGPPAADVEAILDLDEGASTTVVAGLVAARSQGWVTLRPAGAAALPARPVPDGAGAVALPEVDLVLQVLPAGTPAPAAGPSGAEGRWAPGAAGLALPRPQGWSIGAARPGERILVGGRRRALREVLRERSVPRAARDLLPVLRDAGGETVWVPGVAVHDRLSHAGGDAGGSVVVRLGASGGLPPLG